MYDGKYIVSGLVIFLAVLASPGLWNITMGKANAQPNPVLVTQEKACVEPKEVIRAGHMQLLTAWREEVVRGNSRTYVSSTGKTFDKSLTNTCLSCHTNKAEFCDSCHIYAGVSPNCWDCHNVPKEKSL